MMSTSKAKGKRENSVKASEMEEFQGIETFEAPTFEDLPSNKNLEVLYQQFCASNGRRKRKVGMTMRNKRYSKFEQMNVISEDRHLCYASNRETARKIEVAMIEILDKFGDKGNHEHDVTEGAPTEKAGLYIIYLTHPKSDTSQCKMCDHTFIDEKADRIHHMNNIHPREVAELKELREFFVSISDQVSIDECDEFLNWPAANDDSSSEEEPAQKKKRVFLEVSSDDSD